MARLASSPGHRIPTCRLGRLPAVLLSVALMGAGCGSEDDLEAPVRLFDEVPIEYPLPLWDEEVEGTTVLRVRVSETGTVDSTLVLESSGHDAFDSAAVQGGRGLRFEPATRDGERVAVWAHVPVHFSLDGDEPTAPVGGPGSVAGEPPASADAPLEETDAAGGVP